MAKLTAAEEILGGFVAAAAETGMVFHCARCGEVLTDPASIENSWGPVCRKLANAAFASTIPADTDSVLAHLAGVTFKAEVLNTAIDAITAEITAGVAKERTDWRGVANVLVRMIAYGTGAEKAALCNAVEALGYVTLAAVAREEASPSAAEVTIVNGRVVLKTKKNLAATTSIKAIPGRKFHPESKTWSVPVTEFRAVLNVVNKFFPMSKLNVLELATQVASAIKAEAEARKSANLKPAPAASTVEITAAPGGFNVVSPYNAKFVADLKTSLPYKARAWTGKCWWVSADSIEAVKILVTKHYGESAIAA